MLPGLHVLISSPVGLRSFYDTTFRGDSAVEMWMMGEGAHHMHHAQSDVGYSWLTQVCREVEAARPDIRDASRFIPKDIRDIEYSTEMPPTHKEVHRALRRLLSTNCTPCNDRPLVTQVKGRLKANLTSAPRKQPPVVSETIHAITHSRMCASSVLIRGVYS